MLPERPCELSHCYRARVWQVTAPPNNGERNMSSAVGICVTAALSGSEVSTMYFLLALLISRCYTCISCPGNTAGKMNLRDSVS